MNSNKISLLNHFEELKQSQQKQQEQIKFAFDTFNQLVQQFQTLQLPKQNLKVLVQENQQRSTIKKEKPKKVYKEKNLFKRFVTQIVFRNIMQFLSIQDIKQLRLVSFFTNYLIETNIEFLLYHKIQRTKYLESLNIGDYQLPIIPSLRSVYISLRKLISQKGNLNKIPQQLLSYLTLLIDLNTAAKSQNSKRNEYLSKYDIIQAVNQQLLYYPLNWFNFFEKERRIIKNVAAMQFCKKCRIEQNQYDDLKKYIKNLIDFSTSSNYKVICDAQNKDQIMATISKYLRFLNKLLIKIKAKQNQLKKISNLGNVFFQTVYTYCSLQDIIKGRFVCQKFNQELKQHAIFHFQIQGFRIQKQINLIQTNFNLSQSQDEFLYKNKEQPSLMELFYCIQQECKLQNNINMRDFLQINSQQISEIIFKSQGDNELHSRSREQVKECLGIDILVESNYDVFQLKLQRVKECLMEYYVKLPQLQKTLLNLENHQNELLI
ncbi:unnamed protein product (macronuclear) [Paramecium tetraurelia]|uniref:F-box protein n=1 Tax=Paramecium tetraurelia TaxID=5888 RepID=A0EF97_PARTE|nr:uncharacterized protein GSPATT00026311001 [Paramecium tetraurelia]CAK93988.1 unnamed protein product [Paramecium tetraurelia]|eukprot:XP_001461361.1 hypothetical protein (macronuclear) [Paramecium tetraurelia strain d4-2]